MIDIHTVSEAGRLWLGSEASYHSLLASAMKMADASKQAFSFYEDDEEENETDSHFLLAVDGNVGVVSVRGKMVAGVEGSWGQYWGVVGYGDIRNALVTGVNQGVTDFIIDYDTGGGEVNGISEMATFIKDLQKNGTTVTSYSGGSVMSGGLWLASAAENFYAAPMSEIGSLGVIAVTAEMTEMYKEAGISVEVHKSAPLKAAGNPYEKLTDAQRSEIQKNIMETHEFFVTEISVNRNLTHEFVSNEIANGKTWYAAEAQKLGLIDGIKSFDSIFLALRKESADNHSFQHVEASEMARQKQILDDKAAAAIASGAPVEKVLETIDPKAELDKGTDTKVEDTPEVTPEDKDKDKKVEDTPTDKQVEDLQTKLVDLKVELKLAERTNAEMKAAQAGFMAVTATAIQRGFVAIGAAAPGLEGLLATGASSLLVQHAQIMEQVNKRYGAGGQVTTTIDDDDADKEVNEAAKKVDEVLLRQATI